MLVFRSESEGDYHQRDSDLFRERLTYLLRSLGEEYVIIMDHASYHSMLKDTNIKYKESRHHRMATEARNCVCAIRGMSEILRPMKFLLHQGSGANVVVNGPLQSFYQKTTRCSPLRGQIHQEQSPYCLIIRCQITCHLNSSSFHKQSQLTT